MATNHGKAERDAKIQQLWKDDGGECHYCRRAVPLRLCTQDHIIPKALGGAGALWNLVASCAKCNNDYSDDTNKCKCRKCVRARERFYKEKRAVTKEVVVGPRTVNQWVTPRPVEKVLQMLRDRAERADGRLTELDVDSCQAAALRGKVNGYREAIVLLSAAYDETLTPELRAELDV